MDNKIETLKRWLASNSYFDEAHNVSILKVAISLDDAKDLLNTSNRIPKIIKGILWQLKIKHDPKDILILASNYREAVLKLVPADITEKQKAQAIQWLTQIGKRDSNSALNLLIEYFENAEFGYDGSLLSKRLKDPLKAHLSDNASSRISKADIEEYFHWKRFMKNQDLMSINSSSEFMEILSDAKERIQEYKDQQTYMDADKGKEELAEYEEYELIGIHNKGAACKIGKPTNWCTASPGLSYFEKYYNPNDPLFVVKSKTNPKEMYQIHFGSDQFMDINDEFISEEKKNELLDMMYIPGVEKYLGTKLYKTYQKVRSERYSEEDLKKLHELVDTYIVNVVDTKDSQSSIDSSWLPSKVMREISRQIDIGAVDSDEMFDISADILSKYSPYSFFELYLAADYPDIAESLIKEAIGLKPREHNGWKSSDLNLFSLMQNDRLFQTTEIEDAFGKEGPHAKALADHLVKERGPSLLFETKSDYNPAFEYIKEVTPDFLESISTNMDLDKRNRFYITFGADSRRYSLWRALEANFHLKFPDVFSKVLEDLKESLEVTPLNSNESYESLDFIKQVNQMGLAVQFYSLIETVLKSGLKNNYQSFIKYLPKNFDKNIRSDIKSIIERGTEDYIEGWSRPIDANFPGWREKSYDGLFLYRIYSVAYKRPEAEHTNWKNDPSIKMLIEKIEEIINMIQDKLRRRSSSERSMNQKVSVPEDMLLFAATFFPSFWENYSLQYKVNVPSFIVEKFNRSLTDLSISSGSSGMEHESYYDDNEEDDSEED